MPPSAANDRNLIYTAAFLRALSTAMSAVLIGAYFSRVGVTPNAVGLILGIGLAGATCGALLVTFRADRFGRRRSQMLICVLMALGALTVATSSSLLAMAALALIGMLNGSGRDRAGGAILDQAMLPGTVADSKRTSAFASYTACQDVGHAAGTLLAGAPALLSGALAMGEVSTIRLLMGGYAMAMLAAALLYARMSSGVENAPAALKPMSETTRRSISRISMLFAVDGVGGGFLHTTLLTYFFFERFAVNEGAVALLFFAARVLNIVSYWMAARLAARIGLLRTMVFTHAPSSALLLGVPFAPAFPIAAGLFLARELLVEMDVPTRQAYVIALVQAHERTVAAGVTQIVRLGSWAVAPVLAGFLMQRVSLAAPIFIGAGLKLGYDLILYRVFSKTRVHDSASQSPS